MYKLNVTFQTIKPIPNLSKNLKNFWNINQFKKIPFPSIFKTYSKQKLFTVLKSPHVNKKAREQFIYKTFRQNVIFNKLPNINTLLNLMIYLKKIFSRNIKLQFKIHLLKKKKRRRNKKNFLKKKDLFLIKNKKKMPIT